MKMTLVAITFLLILPRALAVAAAFILAFYKIPFWWTFLLAAVILEGHYTVGDDKKEN